MLVYLLFIFACGWCVCWLLFLNYQQHTQDSAKLCRLRRQLRLSSRLVRRQKRLGAGGQQQHDVLACASPSFKRSQDIDIESSGQQQQQRRHTNLVVDLQGRHRRRRLNSDFRSDSLELDGLRARDDEDLDSDDKLAAAADDDELDSPPPVGDLEILEMHDFDEFRSPRDALLLLPIDDELDWPVAGEGEEEEDEELIRGWPGRAGQDELVNEQQQDDDDEELLDLWPLVELHENPLNLIPAVDDGNNHDATADLLEGRPGDGGARCPPQAGSCDSDRALLERSRLLSLSQQEHRAAIRMISPDSVQLFVQETQLPSQQEAARNREEEELGKLRQDERAKSNNNNNLLMMMQQQPAQQQQTIGNNDTATPTNRWPLIAEGSGSARQAAAPGEVTLATASGIERQEDRLQRVDGGGRGLEEAEKQTAGETTGDSSSSCAPSSHGGGQFVSSDQEEEQEEEEVAAGGGQSKTNEISKQAQVSRRQLAARVVERAINLHMQSEQQSQAQVTSASSLPTLQQVQRQMQAARAQLEQRQQERERQQQRVAAQAKPAFQRGAEAAAGPEQQASGAAPSATTKKPKTVQQQQQPSNGLGSSLQQEEISPEGTQSANLLKPSSLAGSNIILNNSGDHGKYLPELLAPGENGFIGERENQQNQAGLQFAPPPPADQVDSISMKSGSSAAGALILESNNNISPSTTIQAKPIPSPRFQQQQLLFRNELTIETRCPPPAGFGLPPTTTTTTQAIMNQRIKDLSNELSLLSTPSGQSTPTNSSMLSDCSTTISVARLLTEAEMNSSELIPKLIERLDRKLVVMKKEQFALMKEIEYNEACGQQLFDSMRQQLTVAEFDKIQTHANEIEKVTKLILSLKLRLKRIEQELKAEQKAMVASQSQNEAQQQQHDSLLLNDSTSSSSSSSTSSGEHPSLFSSSPSSEHKQQQKHSHNTNTSHLPSQSQQQQQQQTTSSKTTCDDASSCCHLATTAGKQQLVQRGVSDPTSTVGLPKRNHHHHASLQAPARLDSPVTSGQRLPISSKDRQVSGASGSTSDCGGNHHRKPSSSSDSIFNSADSAIGSCTIINSSSSASSGHGGSASNLTQVDGAQADNTAASQPAAAATTTTTLHHHRPHTTDHSDHLSSSCSRSSLSSASTPSSPSLMSPTVSTSSSSDTNNNRGAESQGKCGVTSGAATNDATPNTTTTCESLLNLISDVDILMAKRNKLVAQLEEAHQLEECIARRNNNLVERILKKYYDDKPAEAATLTVASGEIALFRQFTKLKSLLLKDSHDINDRIENAEHQLSELKQTSQCQV